MQVKNYLLPSYPSTPYLPFCGTSGKFVAEKHEYDFIFKEPVFIEEKIDGSNLGICIIDGHPVMRNRDKFLIKGKVSKTSAKKQFDSVWNWFYKNQDKFIKLKGLAVYGEWMYAMHTIHYTKLPDYFIAYDLYDPDRGFLPSNESRSLLKDCGFSVVPLIYQGVIPNSEFLINLIQKSHYGDTSEGIYIKSSKNRFKLVKKDFKQVEDWTFKEIKKNLLC